MSSLVVVCVSMRFWPPSLGFTACMSVQTLSLGSVLKGRRPNQQAARSTATITINERCSILSTFTLEAAAPFCAFQRRGDWLEQRVVSHHTQRECVRFDLCWPCGCGNDMLLGRWRQTLSQTSLPQLVFESRIVWSKIFDHAAAPVMALLEERVSTNGDGFE